MPPPITTRAISKTELALRCLATAAIAGAIGGYLLFVAPDPGGSGFVFSLFVVTFLATPTVAAVLASRGAISSVTLGWTATVAGLVLMSTATVDWILDWRAEEFHDSDWWLVFVVLPFSSTVLGGLNLVAVRAIGAVARKRSDSKG